MPLPWSAPGDFPVVIDGVLTVDYTNLANQSSSRSAWRRQARERQYLPGRGQVLRYDAEWDFAWSPLTTAPKIGDRFVDDDLREWRVVDVAPRRNRTRIRCECVAFTVVTPEEFSIKRPQWTQSGGGWAITSWLPISGVLVGRLFDEGQAWSDDPPPGASVHRFRAVLLAIGALEAGDRLVALDLTEYRVESISGASRYDALPTIELIRVD